jgi:hypothetical protein
MNIMCAVDISAEMKRIHPSQRSRARHGVGPGWSWRIRVWHERVGAPRLVSRSSTGGHKWTGGAVTTGTDLDNRENKPSSEGGAKHGRTAGG